MPDNRDDYEPIIATRRSPKPDREDSQPLWPTMLAVAGGLALLVLLGWWFTNRSNDSASTSAQSDAPAAEDFPEIQVDDAPLPQARDAEPPSPAVKESVPQAPSSETPSVAEAPTLPPAAQPETDAGSSTAIPEQKPAIVPEQTPGAANSVEVRLESPDAQVRFELRGPSDSAPVTGKAGDVVNVVPGTYRVVASGARLETMEREVTFDAQGAQEYSVELCAERAKERESVAGRVVEERSCTSTEQCESLFMVLGEEADQLVKDREFRTQQCAKWRANAVPEGAWTLDIKCDGASGASTCRVEIAQGACTFAEPPRTVRGADCPRAELR